MTDLLWLSSELGASPSDLEAANVKVYEAPDVPRTAVVVNLMNGVVIEFEVEGELPDEGFYAERDELRSFASSRNLELNEQNRTLTAVSRETLRRQVEGTDQDDV